MVIRHGSVAAEINGYLREINADKLILGASRGTTVNTFGDDAIEQFAASLEQQTGITVQLIHPEAYPVSNPQISNTPFRSSL
jgi:nucleotide-binding universal stress UspA family protein